MYKIFGKADCPSCTVAKNIVLGNGLPLHFIDVSIQEHKDHLLALLPGAVAVPQIYYNDIYLGSLEGLKNHIATSKMTSNPINEGSSGIKIQLNG
jgi:glutaredoxin